jgi:hypothetical protein
MTNPQPNFIAVRCPHCNAKLFSVARTAYSFTVRIKCRRCTSRKHVPVYLLLTISLEPLLAPDIDLVTENSACA